MKTIVNFFPKAGRWQKSLVVSLAVIMILLSGCKPVDLQSQARNTVTVEFSADTCLPLESIVPAGEDISVTLVNQDSEGVTWSLLRLPLDEKIGLDNSDNVVFSLHTVAGQSSEASFTAPEMAARYDSYCISDDLAREPLLKYLLVVRPR